MTTLTGISFIDLAAQQSRIRPALDAAIASVLDRGAYIMGPEVARFERELAEFCGAEYAIGCANGTDALQLALMALDIGPGDAVFVPTFTFAATAEVVPLIGAEPVFVDSLRETFNMCPQSLRRAVQQAAKAGLTPKAVIPVDLFGLAADMPAIEAVAREYGLEIICDSAQGFGASIESRLTGTFGRLTTTSFFPAKPLGCYGDGGAIFTSEKGLADLINSLRVHGKGADKYENVRIGLNSRLDSLQAAILSVKLGIYSDELDARDRIAERYSRRLSNLVAVPVVPAGYRSVWAQYTVRLASRSERDEVQKSLAAAGVPTMIYYARPMHTQPIYSGYQRDPEGLPVSEELAETVLSLPMHPYLDEQVQDRIIEAVCEAVAVARQ